VGKNTTIQNEGGVAIEVENSEAPKAPVVDDRVPLPAGMKKYKVELVNGSERDDKGVLKGEARETGTVIAADENEAWAKFCDAIKQWPSPKQRRVTQVK
jgi:hypothetical protein